MCGICGKVFYDDRTVDRATLEAMCETLRHRGPDDYGVHTRGPIGLGATRLAIIDLQGGHQPIFNETGSIWGVLNGEIHNYQSLREDLLRRGHVFTTHCDTEVLIHLYEEYGDDFVHQLNGMFAVALWDGDRRRLVLARDRLGIKPLI